MTICDPLSGPLPCQAAKRKTLRIRGLRLGFLAAAAWLAAGQAPAGAQDAQNQNLEPENLERLIRCAEQSEEALRLQCYDAVVQPLADARVDAGFEREHTLFAFSGRDDHDTKTLTFEQPWRARWVFDGSILTVELRLPNGELVNIVGNQIGAGHGTTDVLEPGAFQLAVRAIGKWQIAVEPE